MTPIILGLVVAFWAGVSRLRVARACFVLEAFSMLLYCAGY